MLLFLETKYLIGGLWAYVGTSCIAIIVLSKTWIIVKCQIPAHTVILRLCLWEMVLLAPGSLDRV